MNSCLPLLCVKHASTLILKILFSISIPFRWFFFFKKRCWPSHDPTMAVTSSL